MQTDVFLRDHCRGRPHPVGGVGVCVCGGGPQGAVEGTSESSIPRIWLFPVAPPSVAQSRAERGVGVPHMHVHTRAHTHTGAKTIRAPARLPALPSPSCLLMNPKLSFTSQVASFSPALRTVGGQNPVQPRSPSFPTFSQQLSGRGRRAPPAEEGRGLKPGSERRKSFRREEKLQQAAGCRRLHRRGYERRLRA